MLAQLAGQDRLPAVGCGGLCQFGRSWHRLTWRWPPEKSRALQQHSDAFRVCLPRETLHHLDLHTWYARLWTMGFALRHEGVCVTQTAGIRCSQSSSLLQIATQAGDMGHSDALSALSAGLFGVETEASSGLRNECLCFLQMTAMRRTSLMRKSHLGMRSLPLW